MPRLRHRTADLARALLWMVFAAFCLFAAMLFFIGGSLTLPTSLVAYFWLPGAFMFCFAVDRMLLAATNRG